LDDFRKNVNKEKKTDTKLEKPKTTKQEAPVEETDEF
jgi:hypothetical protein